MSKKSCAQAIVLLGEIREAVVASWLTIFSPRKLAAWRSDRALAQNVQKRWINHSINIWCLVHEQDNRDKPDTSEISLEGKQDTQNFVVFIDPSYSVDWVSDGNVESKCISFIAAAESIAAVDCDFLSDSKKLEYRVQIAHSIVCALQGELDEAKRLLAQAQSYLEKRTVERSREWTLLSLLLFTLFTVSTFSLWGEFWNNFSVGFSLIFGFLGAFASIAIRAGKESWDAASGFLLHFLEVVMRVSVGAIFGLIATNLATSSFGPEPLQALVKNWEGASITAFAAGLFEMTIPRLISQYSRDQSLVTEDKYE